MGPQDFRKMIAAWLDGSLDQEGRKLLSKLLMQSEFQEELDKIMQEQQLKGYAMQEGFEDAYQRMRSTLQTRVGNRTSYFRRYWWSAAAALVLLIAGTWYFAGETKKEGTAHAEQSTIAVIQPGQEGATLTLADGTKVLLDTLGNGIFANQNGAALYLQNGQLEYKNTGEENEKETFNTLATPKGRQFRIMLPDGTVAWLNAASSIRYPTRFAKNIRRVDITGEVYFEAAPATEQGRRVPFLVNADNRFEVEVLGTHFNVNAYEDEPLLNTTLLEGKVAVTGTRTKQKVLLEPGQQASLQKKPAAKELSVRKAATGKVMAWKNGVFDFEDARLDEVMRQLKRWYDIDVKYEAGVPDIEFVGKMTRDIPLNGLLIALEKSNVHFRLEGRTLVVTP
ncbi:MAG: FecR family protein [Pseudobacter sp.]|uniref:FecR family protein n=1 Tax=Pseudobacter sp. TaxID=2045420 RepID=UPI003F809456